MFNNSAGSYGVNADAYWPSSSGPPNVTVAGAGGITMNAARTVGTLFQASAGVTNANNLTLNGTARINAGGFISSGAPTYGGASTLQYNTGGTYGRGLEWSATSGAGYPNNVQLSSSTTLDLGNGGTGTARQCAGNLTIDLGSRLTMNNGANAMTAALTVLGSLSNSGTLTLSSLSGGDLHLGGNWSMASTFTPNGRAVFFEGSAGDQTISGSTPSFDYLIVNKSSGNLKLNTSQVIVAATTGNVLQLLNGGIDLNTNLLTLNGNGGNIGYPAEPNEIKWFMTMLERAAPKMSPDERNVIEAKLRAFKRPTSSTS